MVRHLRRRRPLLVIIRCAFKSHGEGFQLVAGARHGGGDQRGIDPARQENADRYVGDEARGDGGVETLAQLRFRLHAIARPHGPRAGEIVPALELRTVLVEAQPIAGRQLANAAGDRPGLWNKTQREESTQRGGIDRARFAQHRLAGLQIRSEGEAAAAYGIEERLLAEAVARGEQCLRPRIPDREGEHADDARQQAFAPLPPAGEDHFGIGIAAEDMAQPRQLGPDLGVIENLAVEGDDQPVALHRLRAAGGEVDNGEARMHQRAMTVRPDVVAVGTAPAQVIACGTGAALDIAKAAKLNQSRNAAHESTVLGFLFKSHARGGVAGQVSAREPRPAGVEGAAADDYSRLRYSRFAAADARRGREQSDMPGRPESGKIQVTHLVTDLARGGAEVFLQRLVTAQQDDVRHRVISLTGEGELGPEIRAAGVEVAALSVTGPAGAPIALTRLIHMLRKDTPDVLMTWLYHADFLGTIAALFGPSTKLVWNIRCADMDLSKYGYVSRGLPHVLARLSRLPAVVIANSEAGRRIHENYGYGPRRWEILPNGFDMQAFRPDPAQRSKTRAALGVDHGAPVVGLFARFDPMKDHATFLSAADLVSKARPDVLFLLAGRGTDSVAFNRTHRRPRRIAQPVDPAWRTARYTRADGGDRHRGLLVVDRRLSKYHRRGDDLGRALRFNRCRRCGPPYRRHWRPGAERPTRPRWRTSLRNSSTSPRTRASPWA